MVNEYHITIITRGATDDIDYRSRSFKKTWDKAGEIMAESLSILAVLIHSTSGKQMIAKRKHFKL